MFYYPNVLQRHTGCFSTIWLAATRGTKILKREYMKVNVIKTCGKIMQYILQQVPAPYIGSPVPRLSLYLSAQLSYGVVCVYHRQCDLLIEEMKTTLDRLHRAEKQMKIDLVQSEQQSLIPDALAMMEMLEEAPNPFFGMMGIPPDLPDPLMIPQVRMLLEAQSPEVSRFDTTPPSERKLEDSDHMTSPESITLREIEPAIFITMEGPDLPEVSAQDLELLMSDLPQFPEEEALPEAPRRERMKPEKQRQRLIDYDKDREHLQDAQRDRKRLQEAEKEIERLKNVLQQKEKEIEEKRAPELLEVDESADVIREMEGETLPTRLSPTARLPSETFREVGPTIDEATDEPILLFQEISSEQQAPLLPSPLLPTSLLSSPQVIVQLGYAGVVGQLTDQHNQVFVFKVVDKLKHIVRKCRGFEGHRSYLDALQLGMLRLPDVSLDVSHPVRKGHLIIDKEKQIGAKKMQEQMKMPQIYTQAPVPVAEPHIKFRSLHTLFNSPTYEHWMAPELSALWHHCAFLEQLEYIEEKEEEIENELEAVRAIRESGISGLVSSEVSLEASEEERSRQTYITPEEKRALQSQDERFLPIVSEMPELIVELPEPEEVILEDVQRRMCSQIDRDGQSEFLSLRVHSMSRLMVSRFFYNCLVLCTQRIIKMEQSEPYGQILITPGQCYNEF
ncbi:meiotic recombination protein REC8 homolog [Pelodytes ibericus]